MKRITQIALAGGTFLFALILAAPVQAHGRQDNRHRIDHRHQRHHKHFDRYDRRAHRQDRSYRSDGFDHHYDRRHRYDRFDIPHRIHDHRRHVYRPYFERTVYFAPHHHRHAVYQFPVRSGRGWGYREHFYCDGELFLDSSRFEYHGRRFSISIGH